LQQEQKALLLTGNPIGSLGSILDFPMSKIGHNRFGRFCIFIIAPRTFDSSSSRFLAGFPP
jgi:hypothetical protein